MQIRTDERLFPNVLDETGNANRRQRRTMAEGTVFDSRQLRTSFERHFRQILANRKTMMGNSLDR
jgi:hypothetical protein